MSPRWLLLEEKSHFEGVLSGYIYSVFTIAPEEYSSLVCA
jgi:hypothetical protein